MPEEKKPKEKNPKTMKVKLLRTTIVDRKVVSPGEEVVVPTGDALGMINSGRATADLDAEPLEKSKGGDDNKNDKKKGDNKK